MLALTNRIDRNTIYYLSIVVVACIFFEFWWLVFYTGHWMYASKKDADYNSREDGGVEGGVKKMVIYINWITFALKVHKPFSLIKFHLVWLIMEFLEILSLSSKSKKDGKIRFFKKPKFLMKL